MGGGITQLDARDSNGNLNTDGMPAQGRCRKCNAWVIRVPCSGGKLCYHAIRRGENCVRPRLPDGFPLRTTLSNNAYRQAPLGTLRDCALPICVCCRRFRLPSVSSAAHRACRLNCGSECDDGASGGVLISGCQWRHARRLVLPGTARVADDCGVSWLSFATLGRADASYGAAGPAVQCISI